MGTRAKMIADFQIGKLDIIVAGMDAMGEGVTLSKSACVMFVELPWKPSTLQQARDRLHRMGQTRPVNVCYFVAPHALDLCLEAMIGAKADLVAEVHLQSLQVLGEQHRAECDQ